MNSVAWWMACAATLFFPTGQSPKNDIQPSSVSLDEMSRALAGQGIEREPAALKDVQALFEHALGAQLQLLDGGKVSGSAVGQDAVEIALGLDLEARASAPAVQRAVRQLALERRRQPAPAKLHRQDSPTWNEYFTRTAQLAGDPAAERLFSSFGFSPVKISWEDIGRDQGSVWGSRISDVGIWGRRRPVELSSAELMLTVRRDGNFRDKVLMVSAENIKLHRQVGGKLEEVALPARLRELGLLSPSGRFDKNVIVSNQFSIVPVPDPAQTGVDTLSFNFSIDPYGSTNYVIAETIEGASEVVVGGHHHQLIYFNDRGQKAPFTAARSSDRREVVAAAEEMRRAGLDVDVQRFYLIQVPLKHQATGIELGNLGAPPMPRYEAAMMPMAAAEMSAAPMKKAGGAAATRGLEDVVVGHGESEGPYRVGSGFSGQRADERVRVTVCYFVTPRGELSKRDMEVFAKKFREWDGRAVWGGSFVVPEEAGIAAK